ncbi:hydrophobic surface binding protein A-domain-containing protein [Microdochium trichocladiopsis]|uniref:Hydrophobic surface binding protein A-domain-containing protein n=1 Tax=Microdochium trichocladiopsis TaxID=1682393 RepID=A0A9P8Y5D3_9PEZI|nr:hydrophobic surface binding protein A-domain-containing protein [Microdochium trichocladiopsis]KAH7031492.1 hydrophobic surface binding protein A-domain-containing protein [Microdochium trichocladiopsis]
MRFSLVALAALASTVVADLASIQAALNDVSESVTETKAKLDAWKGDLLGTLPIVAGSAELVITLEINTLKIKKSANLTEDEALQVSETTANLISNTLPVLDELAALRPKFDKLLLRPVIYLGLLTQKSATLDLSAAVVSKLPDVFAEIGEALIAELSAAFDVVITQYKPF